MGIILLTYFLMSLQTEVLHTPPISQLPKNILKAPPVDPASADGDQRYKGMLLPKQSGKLKVPFHPPPSPQVNFSDPRRRRPLLLRNGRRRKRIRTPHLH